jgi:hypothetical protein
MEKFQISGIDLLKIDVEGAECEIFETSQNWIERVRTICIELHDRLRPGCREAYERATTGFPKRWRVGPVDWATR